MTNTITLTDEQLADLNAGKSITIDPPQQRGLREGQWVWLTAPQHEGWGRYCGSENFFGQASALFDVEREEQLFIRGDATDEYIDWSRGIHDEKPVEKWEPKGGEWTILPEEKRSALMAHSRKFSESGLERDREDHADRASKKLRQYARLLAWRDEHCPDYVEPKLGEEASYVFWCGGPEGWDAINTTDADLLSVPMPYSAAKQLAHDLNTGKVEL